MESTTFELAEIVKEDGRKRQRHPLLHLLSCSSQTRSLSLFAGGGGTKGSLVIVGVREADAKGLVDAKYMLPFGFHASGWRIVPLASLILHDPDMERS